MIQLDTLIATRKAEIRADEARMARRPSDYPRSAWREANPIAGLRMEVRDLRYKTRPKRLIVGDAGTAHLAVMVLDAAGTKGRIIETIDLTAADAQDRLSRYEA